MFKIGIWEIGFFFNMGKIRKKYERAYEKDFSNPQKIVCRRDF